MDVSSEMIYPLVPLFLANVLGVNMAMIGLIEGVAESTASLIAGWLWDHISPAATFCFGAATATLSALLFIVLIVLIRSSQGLAVSAS
ncbi:MAG: hypothetical protein K0A99_04320 [Desulfoarculaceae bacterium]|nr:hypothetical protein [Desulfoarculaceae bacterium]